MYTYRCEKRFLWFFIFLEKHIVFYSFLFLLTKKLKMLCNVINIAQYNH